MINLTCGVALDSVLRGLCVDYSMVHWCALCLVLKLQTDPIPLGSIDRLEQHMDKKRRGMGINTSPKEHWSHFSGILSQKKGGKNQQKIYSWIWWIWGKWPLSRKPTLGLLICTAGRRQLNMWYVATKFEMAVGMVRNVFVIRLWVHLSVSSRWLRWE